MHSPSLVAHHQPSPAVELLRSLDHRLSRIQHDIPRRIDYRFLAVILVQRSDGLSFRPADHVLRLGREEYFRITRWYCRRERVGDGQC